MDGESPVAGAPIALRHPVEASKHRTLPPADVTAAEPLLEDVLVAGRLVREPPPLEEMRARRRADLERLDAGVKRLVNPHVYHVSLTEGLWRRKQELIEATLAGGHGARAHPCEGGSHGKPGP